MADFFKNLKDDPVLDIDTISNPQTRNEDKDTGPQLIKADTNDLVTIENINDKLNELAEKNKESIEDLRDQASKIIETAVIQSNLLVEKARANFNVKAVSNEFQMSEQNSTPEQTKLDMIMSYIF